VLRAEDLARDPWAWSDLKAALRDREIRVEEPHTLGALSISGAPEPKPIPLDAKVVIVGSPHIYYQLFSLDPDFQTLFKVKADIDPDLAADDGNLATYARLIRAAVRRGVGRDCDAGAVAYLLGQSARWAAHRGKLSARFELIDAVLSEAADWTCKRGDGPITAADVKAAIDGRRARNARVEDRAQEHIATGMVMIDTAGTAVGQVNALTVLDLGDHAFGRPARVTARVYVGKLGIINIERLVALGGPIQQKGVMILQGFLNGLFARRFPLSFSSSITFEQTYGEVEGDSASLAELAAVMSALAEVPIRQDLAITGSVNQAGAAQAVGGVTQKVEGFYRTCAEAGLSGSQGVIVRPPTRSAWRCATRCARRWPPSASTCGPWPRSTTRPSC
jgi:predicted ATP-dependent protease